MKGINAAHRSVQHFKNHSQLNKVKRLNSCLQENTTGLHWKVQLDNVTKIISVFPVLFYVPKVPQVGKYLRLAAENS